MRILHISKYAYPERGGIETFVNDLTTEQARLGHSVRILAHHATKGLPSYSIRENNISITRCRTVCNLAFAPISPALPIQLRRLINEEKPEIIHIHLPNPAVLVNAFFPPEIPLVVHWHADVKGSPSKLINLLYPSYSRFEQRTLQKAAAIIATSHQYLESSESLTPWKAKCTVIPLGLDLERYPLNETIIHQPPPLVASVGRFTYYKGYEHLIQAAQHIPEARFTIAGDGPERPSMQRLVEKLGLAQRFSLPGRIPDEELHSLLQQASVFCLPSTDRGEAFGVVLLEAMRYALPLVSTAIPGSGTGWVNQDGITGRVVAPRSPDAIADAITDLLAHPGKAQKFGAAAQQRLTTNFSISRVADDIAQIYNRISS